ncbi:MAG: ParA family protein [Thermodesulfobacteriota bacterium]
MKKIVTVANPRQGSGKTALAVNIAACLALMEKKTLLVDGDPQGGATSCLLPPDAVSRPGLNAFLSDRADFASVAAGTALDFLKVIPAGTDLFMAEQDMLSVPDKIGRLSRKLEPLAGEFDHILIDSASSLGPLTICALSASASVLIPLPCRPGAQSALEALLPVVADVKKQRRRDLTIAGVVFTHCDGWQEASGIFSEEVLAGIQTVVLNTMIPKSETPASGSYHEPPAVLRDVMSTASERYLEVTAELLSR